VAKAVKPLAIYGTAEAVPFVKTCFLIEDLKARFIWKQPRPQQD
jgi:hypothetical protein